MNMNGTDVNQSTLQNGRLVEIVESAIKGCTEYTCIFKNLLLIIYHNWIGMFGILMDGLYYAL